MAHSNLLQLRLGRALALLTLLGATALASINVQARTYTGVVTHVTDGDTLWVRTSAQTPAMKVRLLGLDAPESCQPWGPQAQAALAGRALYQSVDIQSKARDGYGRVLGSVRLHGEDLGAWLVANGHAWSYGWHGRRAVYGTEQNQAQAAQRGLWAQPAIEPRQFRKKHGACAH